MQEFSVAVVRHADDIRIDVFHKSGAFLDLFDGNGLAPAVACRTLQTYHAGRRTDGFFQRIVINAALRRQLHLLIGNAVFLERTLAFSPQTDNFFQRVVRTAGAVDHLISRTEDPH